MHRLFVSVTSALLGLVVAGLSEEPSSPQAKPQDEAKDANPKEKAKDNDPADDLRQAYVLLRRLRADGGAPRTGPCRRARAHRRANGAARPRPSPSPGRACQRHHPDAEGRHDARVAPAAADRW
jgi:hypothetical protein